MVRPASSSVGLVGHTVAVHKLSAQWRGIHRVAGLAVLVSKVHAIDATDSFRSGLGNTGIWGAVLNIENSILLSSIAPSFDF